MAKSNLEESNGKCETYKENWWWCEEVQKANNLRRHV